MTEKENLVMINALWTSVRISQKQLSKVLVHEQTLVLGIKRLIEDFKEDKLKRKKLFSHRF